VGQGSDDDHRILWSWLGRKDSNLRSPDPESSGAESAVDDLAQPHSCSDPAQAASSHLRFSGESGAHPGRESGAHAKDRKNQVPSRPPAPWKDCSRKLVEPVDHPATGAQVRAEIAQAKAAHPLPAGEVYPDLFPTWAAPNNFTQYLGVQTVEVYAMCSWSHFWVDGHQAGNQSQMQVALPVIEGFPKWQMIVDPRLADDSIRQQMAEVVAGVRAGEAGPIITLIEGACQAWP
jgi:hypothetical protein